MVTFAYEIMSRVLKSGIALLLMGSLSGALTQYMVQSRDSLHHGLISISAVHKQLFRKNGESSSRVDRISKMRKNSF